MSLTDKLIYLQETKQAIKQALQNKGVIVSDNDTFRSYANKINEIVTGGDNEELLQKTLFYETIYNKTASGVFVIPTFITYLGDGMLKKTEVTEIILHAELKIIPPEFASTCIPLRKINLEHVEVINESAFYSCTVLEKVDLTNVTSIKKSAFQLCSSLHTVNIGNKIEEIEYSSLSTSRPFGNCSKLTTINIDLPFGALEVPTHHWGASNSTIYWNDGVQTPPNESVSKII